MNDSNADTLLPQNTPEEKSPCNVSGGCSEDLGQFLDQFRAYLLTIAAAEMPDSMRGKLGASDIVQETILKGYENYGKFHGTTREEFAGWLRTILINQLADAQKAYRSQKRDLTLEVQTASQLVRPDEQSPSQAILTQEQRSVLENAMSRLPDEYREAILLRHRDNLTFVEIGVRLQKSEDAARKIWTRAVKQLRHELQQDESTLG